MKHLALKPGWKSINQITLYTTIGLSKLNQNYTALLQPGEAGCVKGFVTCFMHVSIASLGSIAAAVQPRCL